MYLFYSAINLLKMHRQFAYVHLKFCLSAARSAITDIRKNLFFFIPLTKTPRLI